MTMPAGDRPLGRAAEDYWRAACLISFSHAAGLKWPPPGAPQRPRAVGHWGCNPGIAWAAGHLAEASQDEFLLIVGTGHASSYLFAQQALRSAAKPQWISDANRRYGQLGGEPTELIGIPGVPYLGGELGPALGVGQGIAATAEGLRVVTVIGDGECETPAALAAFAHHDVLPPAPGASWLPVVNVNGARMGSSARFSPKRLHSLLEGMGYTVLSSGAHPNDAAEAADQAWRLAESGISVVWLTITEKGWPASELLGGKAFRGHHAHKPGGLDLTNPELLTEINEWLDRLNDPPVIAPDGTFSPVVQRLARRIRLDLPTPVRRQRCHSGPMAPTNCPGALHARSPMTAVDEVLAEQHVRVLSPDEAASNRIELCQTAGLVTEVLAEELCSAWTWGLVEAGTAAALVSYEAFAPLIATQLAQYLKLIAARPPAGRPPLVVVLTSLGWANSPTHQNTDLVGGLLARGRDCPVRTIFPIGASSARRRLDDVLDDTDVLAVVTCSKQPLLDLPDPGGPAIGIRMIGAIDDDATIVAVGDVAVTESVAAMALAARHGVRIGVVAVVEPGRLDLSGASAVKRACSSERPAVCVSWIASHHLAAIYWSVRPIPTTHLGYRERWGATAWETLAANELSRWSLLNYLRAAGCPLPLAPERAWGSEPLEPPTISYEVRGL